MRDRRCRDLCSFQEAIDILVKGGIPIDQVERDILNGKIKEALGRTVSTAADRRMVKAEIAIYKRNHPA